MCIFLFALVAVGAIVGLMFLYLRAVDGLWPWEKSQHGDSTGS
jgi:hypothetical protein